MSPTSQPKRMMRKITDMQKTTPNIMDVVDSALLGIASPHLARLFVNRETKVFKNFQGRCDANAGAGWTRSRDIRQIPVTSQTTCSQKHSCLSATLTALVVLFLFHNEAA